jgi:hypothetical protein
MARGFKTGGRKKGTSNKRTKQLFDLIQEKYPDFDPLEAMIDIIQSPYTSSYLKAYCIKAILPYMHARRKPEPPAEKPKQSDQKPKGWKNRSSIDFRNY